MTKHQCSLSLMCKSKDCAHATPHTPTGCDCSAPCGNWPNDKKFQPMVKCVPVEQVVPVGDRGVEVHELQGLVDNVDKAFRQLKDKCGHRDMTDCAHPDIEFSSLLCSPSNCPLIDAHDSLTNKVLPVTPHGELVVTIPAQYLRRVFELGITTNVTAEITDEVEMLRYFGRVFECSNGDARVGQFLDRVAADAINDGESFVA